MRLKKLSLLLALTLLVSCLLYTSEYLCQRGPAVSVLARLQNAAQEVRECPASEKPVREDVYKRQALQNEFSLDENIALARQFLLENFVIPVSYTHLDVYKRQFPACALAKRYVFSLIFALMR